MSTPILDSVKKRRVDALIGYVEVSGATPGTRTADIQTIDAIIGLVEVTENTKEVAEEATLLLLGVGI